MRSKWYELKPQAIKLRQKGTSLREIEKTLNIPKSTLSGWFKKVKLTREQERKLKENWLIALNKARREAVIWHHKQKELKIKAAEEEAGSVLGNLNTNNPYILELALAMLYLGEGSKTRTGTIIGSSDPLILKFFIRAIVRIYNIDPSKIKCNLHLRVDQNPKKLKEFWSKKIGVPLENFTLSSIDKRTTGSISYPRYSGVCVVSCGNIAVQRRLIFLSRLYCGKIVGERAVSSAGRASA